MPKGVAVTSETSTSILAHLLANFKQMRFESE